MCGTKKKDDFLEAARFYCDFWEKYQYHKERVYIFITSLYVAGSFSLAVFLIKPLDGLDKFRPVILIGYGLLTLSYFLYRNVQIRAKTISALISDGFFYVSLKKFTGEEITDEDMKVVQVSDFENSEVKGGTVVRKSTVMLPRIIWRQIFNVAERHDKNFRSIYMTLIAPLVGLSAVIIVYVATLN